MKLYEIPLESRIKAEVRNAKGETIGTHIIFHRIDGMYSFCTVEGNDKEAANLPADQELFINEEGVYELVPYEGEAPDQVDEDGNPIV